MPIPHVVLATAIASPNGELAGVLAGVIDLTAPQLTTMLNATSTDQGRFVKVLDSDDHVLLQKNESSDGAASAAPLLATVTLADIPWRVAAGQSRATALAGIYRLQLILLGVGIVFLFGTVAVGLFGVRGFVSSINTLTRNAKVMASGDLSQPVLVHERSDEIGTLGRAFEQMRVELERSHVALTQRLEERTS